MRVLPNSIVAEIEISDSSLFFMCLVTHDNNNNNDNNETWPLWIFGSVG